MKDKKSKTGESRRGIFLYSLGTLGLVLLISAAFLGPKIVFAVQDDIRCGAVVTMSPENVDITSFNTGYEPDLYKRLDRFAGGLAEGRQYYTTVQDMELTSEITDWATSEQGLYQEGFEMLVWNMGLVPDEVFGYNLISWKRCVIYGDDFAGGVNFILWYLELGNNEEPVFRLLVDGETGDIYGIRTNYDAYFEDSGVSASNTLVDYYGLSDEGMWELSVLLGNYYGGLEITDKLGWLSYMGCDYYPVDGILQLDVPAEYEALMAEWEQMEINLGKQSDSEWINRYDIEELQSFLQRLQWRASEDGTCLDFVFPYEESDLIFRIRLDGQIRWFQKWDTRFLDITFGFPEIYERIPVFMEDWN